MKHILSAIKSSITIFFICLASLAFGQQDKEDIVFGKHRVLISKILDQERMLYVKLPKNYDSSDESYPVLFQLYGHFKESYYLPAIRTTQLMQQLGEAPGVIVVGVKNREFRYRDLVPVDHNQTKSEIGNFMKFFEEELVPFINQNYRTNGYKILGGPQAGAAFGIYSLARRPNFFDAYFLSSPFWIEKSRNTLMHVLKEELPKNSDINAFLMITYKDNVSEGHRQYLDSLSELMKNFVDIQYVVNPIDPAIDFVAPVGITKGMRTLFKDYKFPGTEIPQPLQVIEKYYLDISKKYGFEIKIPEHGLVFEGDKFFSAGELDKAKEIFTKMRDLYPNGFMGDMRLGKVALYQGEFETSLVYYNNCLTREPGNPYVLSMIVRVKEAMNE